MARRGRKPPSSPDAPADPSSDSEGQGGALASESDGHHFRETARLVRRAIRERWNVPAGALAKLPQLMIDVASETVAVEPEKRKRGKNRRFKYATRHRIQAVKTVAMMNGQNLKAEELYLRAFPPEVSVPEATPTDQPGSTEVNVSVNVDVVQQTVATLRQDLLKDQDYLDYLESRAVECDAGVIRTRGEQRRVVHGPAPSETEPGTNGSSNGAH